jgi:hypothetical protein
MHARSAQSGLARALIEVTLALIGLAFALVSQILARDLSPPA